MRKLCYKKDINRELKKKCSLYKCTTYTEQDTVLNSVAFLILSWHKLEAVPQR